MSAETYPTAPHVTPPHHDDVPPLRGIYSGASTADMGVEVDVTRLA